MSLVCYTVGGFGESRVLYSWRVWLVSCVIQLEGLVSLVYYTVGGFGESRVLYSWRIW